MSRTYILVRTTLTVPYSGALASQLALEFALGRVATIDENGPCSTFPYESTQNPRMPLDATETQIWMCRCLNDRLMGKKGLLSADLYGTSFSACLVQTFGSGNTFLFV